MNRATLLLLALALVPSQASAWMAATMRTEAPSAPIERTSGWVKLEGAGGKSFYARASELDKLKERKEKGTIELFEGEIPVASWFPSWTAIKNLALWRTEATLSRSAYALEAEDEDWRVVFDAVKGEDRVRLFETERGGRLTVASIAITGAPAAAPPARQGAAEAPPLRVTDPTALATGGAAPPQARSGNAPAPAPKVDALEAAAAILFRGEPASQRLLAAILRDAEATDPGVTREFVEQVSAVKDDPSKLQGTRAIWAENLNDVCDPAPMGNAALEQARAMAGSGAATAASAEGAAAAAGVDALPQELQGLCRERAMAPVGADLAEDLRRAQESLTKRTAIGYTVRAAPPPPEPAAEAGASESSPGKKGKGGGAMKFLAALLGAAIFAVVGSVAGPAAGLAFAGIGGLIGLKSAPKPAKMAS